MGSKRDQGVNIQALKTKELRSQIRGLFLEEVDMARKKKSFY